MQFSYIGTTHDDKKQYMEESKVDALHSLLHGVAFWFCLGYRSQKSIEMIGCYLTAHK